MELFLEAGFLCLLPRLRTTDTYVASSQLFLLILNLSLVCRPSR
jgi:hypothetical protein